MAPVFGSNHLVTIVRGAGTPQETRWQAKMGGDLARKALFYLEDRVRTGDEIHYEFFDEPRVIARVDPEQTMDGPSHWRAEIVPLSEWKRRNQPSGPMFHVSGQGARVNYGSIDRSVQQFHNAPDHEALRQQLAELKDAIEHANSRAAEKADALIVVEQMGLELQRAKPEKKAVWTLLERLNTIGGIGEKLAKVAQALEQSGIS